MKVVNQEKVKKYILRLIKDDRKDYVKATIDTFDISKSSVYNYVKQLEVDKIIEKKAANKKERAAPRWIGAAPCWLLICSVLYEKTVATAFC